MNRKRNRGFFRSLAFVLLLTLGSIGLTGCDASKIGEILKTVGGIITQIGGALGGLASGTSSLTASGSNPLSAITSLFGTNSGTGTAASTGTGTGTGTATKAASAEDDD